MLPLVYQAVLLGVLLKRQRDHARAQEWVVQTKDTLGTIDRLHLEMLVLQGSLRGFVITELPEFDEESGRELRDIPKTVAALQNLAAASSPAQRARLERIASLVEQRVAWHHSVIALMRSNDRQGALDRIRHLEGKRLMDALRREVEAFRAETEDIDARRLRELRESTAYQDRLLLGGLVLNVALGLLAAVFVGRNLTRRVDRLAENARRFSRGEPLAPPGRGSDELADLERTFSEMAAGLREAQRRERAFQTVLEKRNDELERANRDLDHKNDENEMFVYSVSHDLRSPLVNLQGFSKELGLVRDDLRQILEGDVSEEARKRARTLIDRDVSESIHYIQTAVVRLSAIIDALLRLSRAGRVEYHPEIVQLGPVIERIRTALRGTLSEKRAEITVGELPPVWGDPVAIEQIFANLLANAVNYLAPERSGLIEVGFCAAPPERAAGQRTYFVKDNGLGIPQAYLPKVFAIFQRLHGDAARGEGVGLTLVRRMVERHGGTIWVESEVNVGSTFYVSFPAQEQSPLVVAPRKESIRLAGATKTA